MDEDRARGESFQDNREIGGGKWNSSRGRNAKGGTAPSFSQNMCAVCMVSQTWGCECNIVYYIFVLFVYYYVFILSSLATH
jgi:hypothetical protein